MACVLSTTSLEMIPMLAPQRKALRLVHRVICQARARWREKTSARRKFFFTGRIVQYQGGRDSSAILTKRPGRLS